MLVWEKRQANAFSVCAPNSLFNHVVESHAILASAWDGIGIKVQDREWSLTSDCSSHKQQYIRNAGSWPRTLLSPAD